MTDFRPLVERLVSSLQSQDVEARTSAYDRLREILENQFSHGAPDDRGRIDAERVALADAIAEVEAELSDKAPPLAALSGANSASLDDLTPDTRHLRSPSYEMRIEDGARKGATRGASSNRTPPRAATSSLITCILCLLLIGICAAGWYFFYLHEHVTVAAEDDGEAVDHTSGATVPPPVAQIGSPEARDAPPGLAMQRAALLVDAPGETRRLGVYTGRAVWRIVRLGSAPVEAAPLRVKADVDIPDAGLRAEIVFDKNTTPRLPAAYTAEVRFIRQPNSPIGGIDRIGLPEMRDDDKPTGDQLVGSQTKVTDDLFLVGLSNADHEAGNLRLLRSRHWIDLPLLLQGHREAKLTFEKGMAGEAVWDEALAAWGGGPARAVPVPATAAAQGR